MNSRVDIAALVGSAVPMHLRQQGIIVCWHVLIDGEVAHEPFLSRAEAQAWCNVQWSQGGDQPSGHCVGM